MLAQPFPIKSVHNLSSKYEIDHEDNVQIGTEDTSKTHEVDISKDIDDSREIRSFLCEARFKKSKKKSTVQNEVLRIELDRANAKVFDLEQQVNEM